MSYIHSMRTGVPKFCYTQKEYYEIFSPHFNNRLNKLFLKILEGSQIKKRHFSTDLHTAIDLTKNRRVKDKFDLWKTVSTEFYTKLLTDLLNSTQLDTQEIEGICMSTTTGFVMPNLDLMLMDKFELKKDIMRMPFFGFGCSGGISAINRVHDYLNLYPQKAIIVCVGETLSTQCELGDSASNIVTNSLFGDGFSVLLMVGKEHRLAATAQVEIMESAAHVFSDSGYAASQWMTDSGVKSYVDYKLPALLKRFAAQPVSGLFQKTDYQLPDVDYFICHAGGPKVMEAFGDSLNIPAEKLETSLEVFRNFGNQSSVSVLSALEKTLIDNKKPGIGYMMALGPGITLEHLVCKVQPSMQAAESSIHEKILVSAEIV